MPFTFAHPAIIIPFKKWSKYFNFTALVIGSMAPDFEYFLRFKPMGKIGHTFLGFLYFNLPLCFIFAYLFHYVVKKPFILNMPRPIYDWFYSIAVSRWSIKSIRDFIIFIYSSLIGMLTHVLWDAFTHKGGFFVKTIHALSKDICFMSYKIPVYKFLQHGSTLVGFMIIFIYIFFNRDRYKRNIYIISTKIKILYFMCILGISIVIIYYRIFFVLGGLNINYLGSYVVLVINGGFIGATVTSFIFSLLFKYK